MPSRLGDGGRPLDGTPLVENWAAREGDGVDAFVLIGRRDGRLWYAPLLCLDQGAGLARVWDEWVRLGMPAQTAKVPLGKRVAAAGRDWLAAELRGAPEPPGACLRAGDRPIIHPEDAAPSSEAGTGSGEG